MKYRKLLKTELAVSEISFGGMSLGLNHAENQALIHYAFDAGINYFDTADIYKNGFNEETVGKALKPIRKQVILATKVGNVPNDEERNWEWNPTKKYILEAADRSLKRLGTDYIDLYQLHGGMITDDWDESVEAFEILKGQGKILHYGISSIRPNVIRRAAAESGVVSNMIQYSLLDRRPEESALTVLADNQVGVMVRGVLARGFLANKTLSDYLNYSSKDIEPLIDKMKSFSIEKMSLAQLAIQWALARPEVTSVVAGVRNMRQLEDVMGTNEIPSMTADQVAELGAVLPPNHYTAHR